MNDDTYTPCTKCGRPMKYCKGQCCGKPRGCECQEYGPKVCGAIRPGEPKCPYQAVIPSLTVESVGNLKDLADCFVHVSDINTTFYIDDKHRIMTTWAGLVSVENYDFDANPLNLRDQIAYDAKNNTAAIYNKQGANYIFQISDINNDYMLLEDKPQINGVTLEGNKTSADLGILEADEVAMVFDTTLGMIANASSLTDGSYARTLGYRAVDDGGAAFFVIKDTGTADGYGVIDLENGLYAHMIYLGDSVRPEQFGAYGDGQQAHDDSEAIQYAVRRHKVVEFDSNKTYMCYDVLIDTPVTLHGNGCTLKRPDLQDAPYNMTVSQTEKINTLKAHEDCIIDGFVLDNNCFSYWQVSDGHTQGRSAAIEVWNSGKKIKVVITNCTCKNSAGDGIWIIQQSDVQISNYRSIDCFRGGVTIVGYSDVNISNWYSRADTVGMLEGLNTEMSGDASGDSMHLNVSNFITNGQVKVQVPANGYCNMDNVTQLALKNTSERGFTFAAEGGVMNVTNSVLRTGVAGSAQTYLTGNASISISNSKLYGNTENSNDPVFNVLTDAAGNGMKKLIVSDCIINGANCVNVGISELDIEFNGCDITLTGQMVGNRGNLAPQPRNMIISNCKIKFGDRLFNTNKLDAVTWSEGVNYRLSNLDLTGNAGSDIQISGTGATIWFNNLIMSGAQKLTLGGGANPNFYGQGRIITVATASDLNFRGWVAGDDIAIALDTKARYRYTSGTTWTAI